MICLWAPLSFVLYYITTSSLPVLATRPLDLHRSWNIDVQRVLHNTTRPIPHTKPRSTRDRRRIPHRSGSRGRRSRRDNSRCSRHRAELASIDLTATRSTLRLEEGIEPCVGFGDTEDTAVECGGDVFIDDGVDAEVLGVVGEAAEVLAVEGIDEVVGCAGGVAGFGSFVGSRSGLSNSSQRWADTELDKHTVLNSVTISVVAIVLLRVVVVLSVIVKLAGAGLKVCVDTEVMILVIVSIGLEAVIVFRTVDVLLMTLVVVT